MSDNKEFIGYEYKEVVGDSSMIGILMDGYESFGWEVTEQTKIRQEQQAAHAKIPLREKLNIRRDRHINNKVELTRLQRNFEACVNEIERLETAKTTKGTIFAILIGIVGTVFVGLGTFAVIGENPNYLIMFLCAIPGFIGWILPYFFYRKSVKDETERINPIIDQKYEEIYELCKKGQRLR